MFPTRAIFLDRDGTIIEDKGHIAAESDIELYPFAIPSLLALQEKYHLFIVTNQSGVSLGRITLAEATYVNNYLLDVLTKSGVVIREFYCCSHKRDDNCLCIKPKPFFINKAREKYELDITGSYTIGDHPHDVAFGKNNGATGLYLLTGHGAKHRADIDASTLCFENLEKAAEWILRKP